MTSERSSGALRGPATKETDPTETEVTSPHQGETRGFLSRAASGKAIGVVDPWGDERDELTSIQQLDRVVSIYEEAHAPPASPFRAKRMTMMSGAA